MADTTITTGAGAAAGLPVAEPLPTGDVAAMPAVTLVAGPTSITVAKDIPVVATPNADGSTTIVIDMPDVTTSMATGASTTDDGKKTIQVPAGETVQLVVNADGSTTIVVGGEPAAPALSDAYVPRGTFDGRAANYTLKAGIGGDIRTFSPYSLGWNTSFETVTPFSNAYMAGGGGFGIVAKISGSGPFIPTDGSAIGGNAEVGLRAFGPEIWVGTSSSMPYVDVSPEDQIDGRWGDPTTTWQVRGAMRFFAKDYKNDVDLPLFNLSAGLSGPQFGFQTFDAFTGSLSWNPAISSSAAGWSTYEMQEYPFVYVYENDLDGDGETSEAELAQLTPKQMTAQRKAQRETQEVSAEFQAFQAEEKRKWEEALTTGKIEDAYLLTNVGFGSTRLDADGFLTGLSLDRDTQRAEGMAFDNSFSFGTTAYIGLGERGVNGQRPYMLSLGGSYASGWDTNPAADPEYNEDLNQYYRQDELTPETGAWALEARFNIKNTVDVADASGAKVKAPETPHSMIVNDPTASIAVSLASSSAYYLGAWHYPLNDIGGNTNYRDLVEENSLVLGVTGTYSKYTKSVSFLGGSLQVKPAAGFTYDLSPGLDDKDRFGVNAALTLGYKRKGQM